MKKLMCIGAQKLWDQLCIRVEDEVRSGAAAGRRADDHQPGRAGGVERGLLPCPGTQGRTFISSSAPVLPTLGFDEQTELCLSLPKAGWLYPPGPCSSQAGLL